MTRPRARTALVLLATLVLVLAVAAPALATAGGGSSGFGGGGGGGGGGGRGAGLYILFQVLIRIALLGHGIGALVLIGVIVAWVLISRVAPTAGRAASDRQRGGRAARRAVAKRARRVELAAAEAAEDDPAFAPDQVRPAAATLFADIQSAWSWGDRNRLRALVAPGLLGEWERRLDDFARRGWHNRVELVGQPEVQYVGLTRRGGPDGDRVVVRIEATLRDYVQDALGNRIKRAGRLTETVKVREFWTLCRTATGWRLLSIEQGAEGTHALQEQIVATPWSDQQALRDEALVEGAVAEAAPDGTKIAELASFTIEGDARATALDLSLADGRFSPDVLEVSVRRAVAAWADAIDGDARPLRDLAGDTAVHELLHPGDRSGATRVVVRGPSVKQIRIAGLHPAGASALMDVEVTITGPRYIEDRATAAVVAGNPARATTFLERWTFALQDDPAQPWRIVSVDSPVAAR